LYETLLTKEEHVVAEDHGNFYRVPADQRDLNYDKYFVEGNQQISEFDEYNSHNTYQLNVEQVKEKLLSLRYIQEELKGWIR
jgi:UDP-glucose 4-epimerase